MSKTIVEVHKKHLKVLVEWHWCLYFTCGRTISLILKIYFLGIHGKTVFGVISSYYFYRWRFANRKRYALHLKLFWYLVFVHGKPKLLDPQSDIVSTARWRAKGRGSSLWLLWTLSLHLAGLIQTFHSIFFNFQICLLAQLLNNWMRGWFLKHWSCLLCFLVADERNRTLSSPLQRG